MSDYQIVMEYLESLGFKVRGEYPKIVIDINGVTGLAASATGPPAAANFAWRFEQLNEFFLLLVGDRLACSPQREKSISLCQENIKQVLEETIKHCITSHPSQIWPKISPYDIRKCDCCPLRNK